MGASSISIASSLSHYRRFPFHGSHLEANGSNGLKIQHWSVSFRSSSLHETLYILRRALSSLPCLALPSSILKTYRSYPPPSLARCKTVYKLQHFLHHPLHRQLQCQRCDRSRHQNQSHVISQHPWAFLHSRYSNLSLLDHILHRVVRR